MNRRALIDALRRFLGSPDHDDRDWANFTCPFCRARRRFGVNLATGRTKCFRCESDPPLAALFKLFGRRLPQGTTSRPATGRFVETMRRMREAKLEREPVDLSAWVRLPSTEAGDDGRRALAYARSRYASPDDWEFGVILGEAFAGRVVFTVRECGVVLTYQARDCVGRQKPKTLNPPAGQGVPAGQVLFGAEHVRRGDRVAVCEGVFDAVAVSATGEWRGVSLLGRVASEAQVVQIAGLDAREVVVCLDGDAGPQTATLAGRLAALGVPVRVVDWAGDLEADPSSEGPDRMWGRLDAAGEVSRSRLVRLAASAPRRLPGRRWRRTSPPGRPPR